MSGFAKRLSGAVVVLAVIVACGESVDSGAVAPAPDAAAFQGEISEKIVRQALIREVHSAPDASETGVESGELIRQAFTHEFDTVQGPSSGSDRLVVALPVR